MLELRTLVLNLDMRPLSTISVFRALRLLEAKKVWLMSNFDAKLRSPSKSYDAPAVVVLSKFIGVPRELRTPTKRLIFLRDKHTCQYCGGKAYNIDHVVPRSRGGTHTWDNVVAACGKCNTKKADKLLTETNMELMTMPVPISWSEVYKGHFPEWDKALMTSVG